MFDLQDRAASASADKNIEKERQRNYPKEIWWTLACFIALVSVLQFASFVHSRIARRKRSAQTVTDQEQSTTPARHGLSLRRIPLACVNVYRVIAFRWTLEFGHSYTLNLAEVVLTMMYMATLYVWAFINTTDLEGHNFDIGYWANRAGTLSVSQLPIITALGTKNNVVSFITGVSYDRLNYIHRMMARVVMVLIWTHAGARIHLGLYPDIYELYLRAGIFAAISFSLLCIVSIRPIRAGAYEVFFYSHVVTAIILLVGAFYHTRDYDFQQYVWASFIIWGVDRALRWTRIVLFNYSYFGFKSGSGTLDASTELLSDHLVRLRLRRSPHFHWKAGQTAYLIMPSVSTLPFEAHPFTISSFDSSATATASENSQDDKTLGDTAPYWKELVFLINVRTGFTKRLRDVAEKNGTVKVYVDGPYGPSPDSEPFQTSVLIAGGSGVSYTLPVLLDTIERVRNGTSLCRKVVFIWAIRDARHIEWISDTLAKAIQIAPPQLEISIRISCTGAGVPSLKNAASAEWVDNESVNSGSAPSKGEETVSSTERKVSVLALPAVSMSKGRPDLKSVLREEVDAANGRMLVSVCGSQAVTRAVRHALRFPVSGPKDILKGGPSVVLHIESFGYA